MGQVSKRHLTPTMQSKVEDLLPIIFSEVHSLKEAQILFLELLTPTERLMIGKRLGIIFLHLKGYSYNEIKSTMKVSASTIWTTFSNVRKEAGVLEEMMKKLVLKREKEKRISEQRDDADSPLMHPGTNWSSREKEKHKRRREREEPL